LPSAGITVVVQPPHGTGIIFNRGFNKIIFGMAFAQDLSYI